MFGNAAAATSAGPLRALASEEVDDLDGTATLNAAGQAQRVVNLADARVFRLAAHWADLHGVLPDADQRAGRALAGMERLLQFGGDGTPEVAEFAPAEFAAELGMSPTAGQYLVADALDLRHRLPRLWNRLLAGEVKRWMARRTASATRHLSQEAAARVDERITPWVGRVGGKRFHDMLEAAVIAADPDAAEERAKATESEHGVWITNDETPGSKKVFARTDAFSAALFDATVDRIAGGLKILGDTSTHQQRRATALGVMANPQQALQLFDTVADLADEGELPDTVVDKYTHPGSRAASDGATDSTTTRSERGFWQDPGDPTVRVHRGFPDPAAGPGSTEAAASRLQCRCGCHAGRRVDPSKLRPPATLYVHLAAEALTQKHAGVARIEGEGPVTLDQARAFLRHANVTVQPVIDPIEQTSVDAYEVPERLREAVHLISPSDCFPFATCTSRSVDIDHTDPYRREPPFGSDPPPAQTRIGNLGPLTRRHHRIKTFGGWNVKQPFPGVFVWRSPHGRYYLVDPTGTRRLN